MSVQTESEVERAELETVLASGVFSRSPNLAKMLRYIGLKYLEGQQGSIKEYNIGVEALERPPDFDPKRDSIVRVEAVRLRQKLKQYYETEGADHAVVISLQVGHYFPRFLHRSEEHGASANPLPSGGLLRPPGTGGTQDSSSGAPQLEMPDREGAMATADSGGTAARPPIRSPARGKKWQLALALIVAAVSVAILAVKRAARPKVGQGAPTATAVPVPLTKASMPAAASAVSAVRIIAGYSVKDYVNGSGETWGPDRYYTGGHVIVEPQIFIARAPDPTLFKTAREGEFSYNIPLKPGTYELRLYFVETEYGPGTPRGGGENSRVFSINMNGKPLLTDFDIYSDAGGTNIADERVFKDVSPAADGELHLSFVKEISYPILNALDIFPSPPGEIQPIRIVAQKHSYTDTTGHVWKPDRYFMSGSLVNSVDQVQRTRDPGLYAEERYGNFSYAIPVAKGRYAVTLYFAETHFGPDNLGGGGVGSRVFEVDCNGVALLRSFDIFKEAGGDNRAVVRTFQDLRPNAQGKLLLSFGSVKNYASLRAIEIIDESQ
jgi:Malectin domain